MVIFEKTKIERFAKTHSIARVALSKWVKTIESTIWRSHNELKETFPTADYVGNSRYVFNIKGNGFRIVAVMVFAAGTLTVRFVGTHEEYNKIDCKTI
jgi:mRNA interferase HigB